MKNDNKSINLSMLADYYEFTMANGYIANGVENTEAVFDMFFRNCLLYTSDAADE